MADPLSIAAGLVGVAGAAISTCKVLFRCAETVVQARKNITDLAQSLANFSTILNRLASVIERAPEILDEDGIKDIEKSRDDCQLILSEIGRVFKKLDKTSLSVLDRAKWLFKQDSLRYPKARLEVAKTNLMLNIEILILAINLREKPSSRQVFEVGTTFESAKVFVAVRRAAAEELRASAQDDNRHAAQDSSPAVIEQESSAASNALIRNDDEEVSSPFAGLRIEPPPDVISSLEARASNAFSNPRSEDGVIVASLVRQWTKIQDTSILTTNLRPYNRDGSDSKDAVGMSSSDAQGGWSIEVEDIEEVEAKDVEEAAVAGDDEQVSDTVPKHAPQDASVLGPSKLGAKDLTPSGIDVPGEVAKAWNCQQRDLGNWGKVVEYSWPKVGSVEESHFNTTEFVMTGNLVWDPHRLDRDPLNILLPLTVRNASGKLIKLAWPAFVVPHELCRWWKTHTELHLGLEKAIQGICLFYLELAEHMYLAEQRAGRRIYYFLPSFMFNEGSVKKIRKLYHAARDGKIELFKVSRTKKKDTKTGMLNRRLKDLVRSDSSAPCESTRFSAEDWDDLDFDYNEHYIEVYAKKS